MAGRNWGGGSAVYRRLADSRAKSRLKLQKSVLCRRSPIALAQRFALVVIALER